MSHSHKFFTHRDTRLLTDKQVKETRRAAECASKSGTDTPRKPQNDASRQHAQERLDTILREKSELFKRQADAKKIAERKEEDETKSILAQAKEDIAAEKVKEKETIDAARATYHLTISGRARR